LFFFTLDPTHTLSGPRDFYRGTEAAKKSATLDFVPDRDSMFSELAHYPKGFHKDSRIKREPRNLPLDASEHERLRREAAERAVAQPMEDMVSGANRHKFVRAPLAPSAASLPANSKSATKSSSSSSTSSRRVIAVAPTATHLVDAGPRALDGLTREIAMQTAYREGEVQTDPFSPEFVVAPGTDPEIAKLAFLKAGGDVGQALPVGKAEVEAIERSRRRRAIEDALPPITDEASFLMRKRLMVELELESFLNREGEMDSKNNRRLHLVERALLDRTSTRELMAEQRVESLRRQLEEEKDVKMATVAKRRAQTLRKLGRARTQEDSHIDMLTGTGTFLGVAGSHPGGKKPTRDIIADYANYGSKVYAPNPRSGFQSDKLHLSQRFEAGSTAEALRGVGGGIEALVAGLPLSLTTVTGASAVPVAVSKEGGSKAAATSRADEIYAKNLETVHNLIKTTKAGKSTTAILNEEVPAWRKPKPEVERPVTPDFDHIDKTDEEIEFDRALVLIQSYIRGRAVQNIMHEGKERRLELIKEMRADLLSDEAAVQLAADEAARSHALESETALRATEDAAAGEAAAAAFDFLAKELVRAREVSKINRISAAADAERNRREAAEAERRRVEEHAKALEAAHERASGGALDRAVNSLVHFAIATALVESAFESAGRATGLDPLRFGPVVANLEKQADLLEKGLNVNGTMEEVGASELLMVCGGGFPGAPDGGDDDDDDDDDKDHANNDGNGDHKQGDEEEHDDKGHSNSSSHAVKSNRPEIGEDEAAKRMQKSSRGFVARRRASKLQLDPEVQARKERAKLSGAYSGGPSGKQLRKEAAAAAAKAAHHAALEAAEAVAAVAADEAAEEEEGGVDEHDAIITSSSESKDSGNTELDAQNAAAMKLQASSRGFVQRRKTNRLKNDPEMIARIEANKRADAYLVGGMTGKQKRKQAALEAQARATAASEAAAIAAAAVAADENSTSTMISTTIDADTSSNHDEQERAAMKMQAGSRGFVQRRKTMRLKEDPEAKARSQRALASDAYSGGMSGKARRKAEAAAAAEAAKKAAEDAAFGGSEGKEEEELIESLLQAHDQSLTSLTSETSLDLSAEQGVATTETTAVLTSITEESKE